MNIFGRKRVKTSPAHRNGIAPRGHAVCAGLLALIICASNLSGKEFDRLLVAVNGRVITEGDLYIARSINSLVFSGENVVSVSRKAEIDSLIDLELIRQELENFSLGSEDAVDLDARVKKLRDRLEEKGGFVRLLDQLGLQESELNSYLKFQLSILDFVEYRFSPFAEVSEAEIEAYYNDTFGPQLLEPGGETPPLAEVSGRIEEILEAENINEALEQWLMETRSNARIEYFDENAPGTAALEHSREGSQPGETE